MAGIKLLQIVVCSIVLKTTLVSCRSYIPAAEGGIVGENGEENVLYGPAPDRAKRSPVDDGDVSIDERTKFTNIAHKIKDVIDKIQPDERVVATYMNGFRDIDFNYNLFHAPEDDGGDSPIRRLLLEDTFHEIISITKEVEQDVLGCPVVTDSQIGRLIAEINGFIEEFQKTKRRFIQLPKSELLSYVESLGNNGTISDSKNVKTPRGNLLRVHIQELANLRNTLPYNDSFPVKCALADGALTYISTMIFALDLQSYLADAFYRTGDMEKYNNNFNLLVASFRDFKNSLLGESGEPLLQNVLDALQMDSKELTRKQILLREIKDEIEHIELPMLGDMPEKLMGKPDFEDEPIKTPIGPWIDGANVTYAIQYRHNGMHSRIGEWMEPVTISGQANPTLIIRVHPKRYERLVFRKFNNQKPQLVGILQDKYQTEFRDINRDLYDAAARFDRNSMDEAQRLIDKGADIDAVFEGGRRAIHAAALSDNIPLAKKFLIKAGNDTDAGVNFKDNDGYTPMHVASEAGRRRFVQLLLENGGDVNAKTNGKRWTPAHIAADRGFVSTLKTLLKSSVIDTNSRDIGGFTPLHRAVRGGIPVLNVLMADSRVDLQAKSNVGLTSLMLAVIEEYADVTGALLDNGKANPNLKDNANITALAFASLLDHSDIVKQLSAKSDIDKSKAVDGWTPLHLSVALKNKDVIATLLSNFMNQTNVLTDSKISPLHVAVVTNQKEIVQNLINHGATIDERIASGLAPIHLALLHKKFEIFDILVESGADLQAKSTDGSSLLHFAIANNKFDIIESLVKKGVDINAKNINTGETPLHTAARNGYSEVVNILVQHGANLNCQNNQGETPLHYVASHPDYEVDILNILTSNGAAVDQADNLGRTPLHLAVNTGQLVKVAALIRKGASVKCKDFLGNTPLHMASRHGSAGMVKYLLTSSEPSLKRITDSEGRTPLHIAVKNGHTTVVKALLGQGYSDDLNTVDTNFQTPLHIAIIHNNNEIFNELLALERGQIHDGEDCDHSSRYGGWCHNGKLEPYAVTNFTSNPYFNSPLHLAILLGRKEMIETMYDDKVSKRVSTREVLAQSLIETAAATGNSEIVDLIQNKLRRNEFHYTSLCTAIEHGHINIVDEILANGRLSINGGSDENNIPICCTKQNLNMMEHLISKEASVNITCPDGLTPLQRAAKAGHTDIVKTILKGWSHDQNSKNQDLLRVMVEAGRMDEAKTIVDQGAALNSTALGGTTLLHILAQSGTLDEVKALIDQGSNVNVTTFQGATPMHFAAKGGKADVINYLARQDSNVNAVDTLGRTPLHWALGTKSELNIVKTLVDHGATVNQKCLRGKTPLHVAVEKGVVEVVAYLTSHNADVNAVDSEGNTPIFGAVRRGNIDVVKNLVEAGADVTILNYNGESPLHYVTAVPNIIDPQKSDNYNNHLNGIVNQPAMGIANYLRGKGAKM